MKRTILAASIFASLSGSALAATYQLTELPRHENSKYTFVSDANEAGDIIGAASFIYKLPIDVSYLDIEDPDLKLSYDNTKKNFELIGEEITFTLQDIKNGVSESNADAHQFMLNFLTSSKSRSAEFQKISDRVALVIDANTASEKVLFDINSTDTNGLTRSVSNFLTSIADDGTLLGWGSAPYQKTTFTPKDETEAKTYFIRDWSTRGVVITPNGQQIVLPPEFDTYGGSSLATDIVKLDDGGYVIVGQSSMSVPENRQETYNDLCDGEDEPLQVCAWQRQIASSFYNLEAYKWTLDADFNITSKEALGLGIVRDEDDKDAFSSFALAVNKAGIAVGYSQARHDDRLYSDFQPGYFKDGKFKSVIDHETYFQGGKAVDINEQNIIAGFYTETAGNNSLKEVGFYYDLNTESYVELPTYFSGSRTTVTDINNEGYIIGQAEIERNGSNRRREAFRYKIGDDKITNINDFLPCRDASGNPYPYTIAEAIKITDNNHIYAIATKTVERKDRLGNVMKDSDGEIEYESVTLPVVLTPISGTDEKCDPPEAEVYERKSGSLAWFSILAMPLAFIRRRKIR